MSALPESLNAVDVQSRIDRYYEEHRERPRAHLGLSLLGHHCDRWIWLSFRWAVIEPFPGRILRLFRRGQREEETIVTDLRNAGLVLHSTCLDDAGQGHVDFGCHVSGSMDGIIESGVPGAEKTRHVLECKTHSLKSFNNLKNKGVKESKRQHWWQMQGYMLGTGIDRALYVAVCKDNDEMYTERVPLQKNAAKALIERGHRLALLERIPEPISADPTWWQCKFCAGWDFCFGSKCTKQVNCRTCAHVTPCRDSSWRCARFHNSVLTPADQILGCENHVLHPDLVPWQNKGCDKDGYAKYIIGGKEVLNGPPRLWSSTSKALLGQEPDTRLDVDVPF